MRQVKFRNYVILAVIVCLTVLAVLFLRNIYLKQKDYENTTNNRIDILYEIKEDDLQSYLVENSEVMIYISNASNETIADFEKQFKNYIADEEVSKEIVYLNLDKVSSTFYKELKEKYFDKDLSSEVVQNQANLLSIKGGKVVSILYPKETSINIEDVKRFLRVNNVVNE